MVAGLVVELGRRERAAKDADMERLRWSAPRGGVAIPAAAGGWLFLNFTQPNREKTGFPRAGVCGMV